MWKKTVRVGYINLIPSSMKSNQFIRDIVASQAQASPVNGCANGVLCSGAWRCLRVARIRKADRKVLSYNYFHLSQVGFSP
jgi:hypothetical protein